MQLWVIKHLFSPPYHPASNGLAKKSVHIIKDKLKKMDAPVTPLSLQVHITDVLHVYRGTVHSATSATPYELMLTKTSFRPIEKGQKCSNVEIMLLCMINLLKLTIWVL